jgi:homoserine O-acetyltransferase
MKHFHHEGAFELELGGRLSELTIGYHTYGALNERKDNAVWICHALTANSDARAWWPGLIGPGCGLDPERDFIVCANIIGSCYGTTGPLSECPETGTAYFHKFPLITIRDMVKAHQLLCAHLGITRIKLLIGGSMGGYQALEWAATEPARIERLFLLATSARESAWGVAIHTAQRLAIEADATWGDASKYAGVKGLKAARAIAMLTYRNYETYRRTQMDEDPDKTDDFKASSYIAYQGDKLAGRFNAYSYWFLTKAMDSHNLARGRAKEVATVLAGLPQPTLILGISSDLLCPVDEAYILGKYIPDSDCRIIDSPFGHDGFLTEIGQISSSLNEWMK